MIYIYSSECGKVEELNEREEVPEWVDVASSEGMDPAMLSRLDLLLGEVPQATDFQSVF